MKTSIFFSWILGCLLLMSSCQKDQIDTTSWLNVETNEVVQLESGASEMIIPVSSSHGNWAAITNAEWLELTQVGNSLLINAQANEALSEREAKVVISSGNLTKSFKVLQGAYPTFVVETSPAHIVFGQPQGQMRVLVLTNADNWTIENTADWLEVVPRARVGELVLRVTANETTDTRKTRIILRSSKHEYALEVKQEGKIHFILPIPLWGKDLVDVERVERARGSKIESIPNANSRIPDYVFTTRSEVFPRVKYEFVGYGDKQLYIASVVGDPTIIYSPKFLTYLEDNGFTRVSPEDKKTGLLYYTDKEKKIDLYIYTQNNATTNKPIGYVTCKPIVDQPKAMPTLDKIEFSIDSFGESTMEDVETWEQNHGGVYDKEFSTRLGLPFYFSANPVYGRGYFFVKKTPNSSDTEPKVLNEYILFYINHTLGLYKFGALDYVTKEFDQLLGKYGFTYDYYNPISRGHIYTNLTKQRRIVVRSMSLGKYVLLRMNIFSIAPKASAVTAGSEYRRGTMFLTPDNQQ